MNKEELNQALFEKMSAEMKDYADWLLQQPPAVILNHALPYVTKFDIVSVMEGIELNEDQARALLSSATPLDDVYKQYDGQEVSALDIINEAIYDKADAIIESNQETAAVPVYPYPGNYAEEHGELEQYRQSQQLNIDCKDAIRAAIVQHYSNNTLNPEAIHQVVAQYGLPRTLFVLANTVQQKDWDGRLSPGNKAWARPFTIYPDEDAFGNNKRLRYVVDCHPGLTDVFINIIRKEYCQQEQQVQKVKPSVRAKLHTQPKPTSPKHSAKLHQQER